MIILGIGLIAICLGGAVGYIAVLRGRPFVPWFLYGTFLGPVALPHALLTSSRDEMQAQAWSPIRYGLPSGHRTCPYCDAVVHEDAIACRRCRRPFYGPGSEGAGEGESEDEPTEEPFAFEALEAAIARRSAAAHGRRGSRREPPPQDAAERPRRSAPSPEEAPAARREEPADGGGTPSHEAAGTGGRADEAPATRQRAARRSAAARTAAQPSRSAPVPERPSEAEDGGGDRTGDATPEAGRPAAAREREQPANQESESPRSPEKQEPAAKQPDTPAHDRNVGADSGTARGPRSQPTSAPSPAAPANDPAAPAAGREPTSDPQETRATGTASQHETTARQEAAASRPAGARAHPRWRDAAAARNAEQRPLRASDRPSPGPTPQDDLWGTWRGGTPGGGAERTKRAAQAAAAVLCVIAVGGLAWWYGPTAMQQVAMAPSLFGDDDASTDLDGRAVEVPERELATPAPSGDGGGTLAPEGTSRPGDELAASRSSPDGVPSGDGSGSVSGDGPAGKQPAEAPSQPPIDTAEVPAPTGSAAAPGDAPSDGGADQGAAPAETASTRGAPDAVPSQMASRSGDAPASAGGGPTRLERHQDQAVDAPTPENDAPAQRQPVDDLVKAVTAALAEHTGRRNASTSATSGPEGRATPAAVRVTATGDLVARVQQLLRARGFAPGPIDGRAGPQTREAIRKYQQRMGMRTTGEIDKAMLISLGIL